MALMDAEIIRLTNLVERRMLELEETKTELELLREQFRIRYARTAELERQLAAVKRTPPSRRSPT